MGINLLGLWFLTSYLWNFLELSLVVGFTLSFRCVRQQPRPPCHLGLPWFALLSLFRLGPAQSDIMVPGSACTHHPARLPPRRRDSAWRTRFPPTPTGANSPGASIDTDDRELEAQQYHDKIWQPYDNVYHEMEQFYRLKESNNQRHPQCSFDGLNPHPCWVLGEILTVPTRDQEAIFPNRRSTVMATFIWKTYKK